MLARPPRSQNTKPPPVVSKTTQRGHTKGGADCQMRNPKTAPSGLPYPQPENGWVHKCDVDDHLNRHLPIPTQVVSNEEYFPIPQTAQQKEVEFRLLHMAHQNAKRLALAPPRFLR